MSLATIPSPGLAVFPQNMSTGTQTLTMRGEAFGSDWTVVNSDSNGPSFTISSARMSLSHRKYIHDAKTEKVLCEIRKESFSSQYAGNDTATGSELFATDTSFHFSGTETEVRFSNQADGGKKATLVYKKDEVKYEGKVVAVVTKKTLSMSGQYDLVVAPGLDPFLIVGLVVVLIDREKSRSSGAAAAGGAAAGGGGA